MDKVGGTGGNSQWIRWVGLVGTVSGCKAHVCWERKRGPSYTAVLCHFEFLSSWDPVLTYISPLAKFVNESFVSEQTFYSCPLTDVSLVSLIIIVPLKHTYAQLVLIHFTLYLL